ncbi:MAG: ABC transporter permease subunit [Candidatus Delongbacteria bacterium]|nr:ABC transporter permease subunit [Candidatus Delongbacteria bacterium]
MNKIAIIYKKELKNFFNSPVAYITLVVFLLIGGWFFTSTLFLINESDLRTLFQVIPIIYIFFIPAITMGLIAKERNDNTMEFLTTLPFDDKDIVIGKFLAALSLIGTALLFTLVHFITLTVIGTNLDVGALLSGYLGLFLVGGVYAAIGTFSSSVTNNQITAFIISFLIIFLFFMMDKILFFVPGFMTSFLQFMSIDYHLSNISRGVIDSRNLIYFGSVISFFLLISTRILEIRKWR